MYEPVACDLTLVEVQFVSKSFRTSLSLGMDVLLAGNESMMPVITLTVNSEVPDLGSVLPDIFRRREPASACSSWQRGP
jgi:hypothetical protein